MSLTATSRNHEQSFPPSGQSYQDSSIKAEKIFGTPTQVYSTGSTLFRLIKLDDSLRTQRQKSLDTLAKIWEQGLQTRPESVGQDLLEIRQKLAAFPSRVQAVFTSELESVKTADQLAKCARRFFKDVKSCLIAPIKKSHCGINGPTFLVSYPRLDKSFTHVQLNNSVIKWTSWNELCCNRVYDHFSRSKDTAVSRLFHVPYATALDFDAKIYENIDGSHTELDSEIAGKLKEKFLAIASAKSPDQPPKDKQVMIMERIPGENLFDFVKAKYQYLSPEQKDKFLTQLGRVAMLDVVMGHLDRLVRVIYDENEKSYTLMDIEANLGNLMVVWSGKEEEAPVIFAIDNGLEKELIESSFYKQTYLQFLKELNSHAPMEKTIAQSMQGSVAQALINSADDEGNVQEARKLLAPFSKDLTTFGEKAFCRGITEMSDALQATLIPEWESEQTKPLKGHLAWACPELLEAISERFEMLKTVRN